MPPKKDAPKKKASAPAKLMSGGKKAVEEKAVEEKDKVVERIGARRLLMQQEVVDLPSGDNI